MIFWIVVGVISIICLVVLLAGLLKSASMTSRLEKQINEDKKEAMKYGYKG